LHFKFATCTATARGRALCVQLFDALGANDPLAHASRRRLSNIWFI
jgi:thioredoxin-like negative regulator of GroEL